MIQEDMLSNLGEYIKRRSHFARHACPGLGTAQFFFCVCSSHMDSRFQSPVQLSHLKIPPPLVIFPIEFVSLCFTCSNCLVEQIY